MSKKKKKKLSRSDRNKRRTAQVQHSDTYGRVTEVYVLTWNKFDVAGPAAERIGNKENVPLIMLVNRPPSLTRSDRPRRHRERAWPRTPSHLLPRPAA
jgi:hypothetical protein